MNKDDFATFGGSLTANVISFDRNAIPEPDTLIICMTRGERRIADELRKTFGGFKRVVIDVDGERHEYDADSTIRLLESYESYGQVSELGERESYGEVCGDDRFELIGKAKAKLLEATNIEMRPDKMAVIDSILFRCWQMGWLDKLRDDSSRYSELFGTPERAARTLEELELDQLNWCRGTDYCEKCPYEFDRYGCYPPDGFSLLEWLRGDKS
jgi:hypothetical protein